MSGAVANVPAKSPTFVSDGPENAFGFGGCAADFSAARSKRPAAGAYVTRNRCAASRASSNVSATTTAMAW